MTKMKGTDLKASAPAWAKAALIAELEHDDCDLMTDYFNTTTSRRVFLAWSRHTKDLFSEMRKAALLFPETAHMGPGKDLYTVYVAAGADFNSGGSYHAKGETSYWHNDLLGDRAVSIGGLRSGILFHTRDEVDAFLKTAPTPEPISVDGTVVPFAWAVSVKSLEHREKYSMGAGYYLKDAGTYSTGWTVSKVGLGSWGLRDETEYEVVQGRTEGRAGRDADPVRVSRPDASTNSGPTVTLNAEKNGVEIRFPAKPSEDVRTTLKANGWRWSRFSSCWYNRDNPSNRAFAENLTGGL